MSDSDLLLCSWTYKEKKILLKSHFLFFMATLICASISFWVFYWTFLFLRKQEYVLFISIFFDCCQFDLSILKPFVFRAPSYDDKYKSIFMTARQKAEERNLRLMAELKELHGIMKKDPDHKQKKANFNSIKVVFFGQFALLV